MALDVQSAYREVSDSIHSHACLCTVCTPDTHRSQMRLSDSWTWSHHVSTGNQTWILHVLNHCAISLALTFSPFLWMESYCVEQTDLKLLDLSDPPCLNLCIHYIFFFIAVTKQLTRSNLRNKRVYVGSPLAGIQPVMGRRHGGRDSSQLWQRNEASCSVWDRSPGVTCIQDESFHLSKTSLEILSQTCPVPESPSYF